MKTSNVILLILVLIVGLFTGYKVREFVYNRNFPEGGIVVSQATIDSLNAYIKLADSLQVIATQPPDTVYQETVVYKDSVVYVETTPVVIEDDRNLEHADLKTYKDSIYVEDEINAWVKYKVRGYVEGNSEWGYIPIIKEKETIIERKVPYPVIENVEIPKYITGNYLSVAAGGNDKMFIFGVDYDLVRPSYIYGLQYRRFGEVNVYGVKIGVNLNSLIKNIRNGP